MIRNKVIKNKILRISYFKGIEYCLSNVSESLFAPVVMVHLCVQDSRVFHTVVTDCKRHKHEDEGSCFVYCFGIIETRDNKTIFLLHF